MKDKKRVLTILLVLILLITIILIIVQVFGGIKTKELKEYYEKIEVAACKYAKDENYTIALCKSYSSLCQIHYETLVENEYIDANLKHPLSREKIANNKIDYVEIAWRDGKMECYHKEG